MDKRALIPLHIKHLGRKDIEEIVNISAQESPELYDKHVVYNGDVKNLMHHYDISKENARRMVGLVGYKNADKCMIFLSNSTLDERFYLTFVECVSEGKIKIDELKNSSIDLIINGCIEMFNLSKKQLEQKVYRRRDPNTGTIRSIEDPSRGDHEPEHLDTRVLDNYD